MISPALEHATALVGDRWTLLVLAALREGPLRFGDLSRELGAIAPNVLSSRLRDLTMGRLVLAEPYQRRPLRMTYDLTPVGRQLAPALLALEMWGAALGDDIAGPWHGACGTPLELRAWCPSCETVADHPGGDDTVFV